MSMADGKPATTMRRMVVDAFRNAKAAKLDPVGCYQAATDAWCNLHPEHSRAEAATRVVTILHEELGAVREAVRRLFERL
jgi:hypothetical protein